MTAPDGIDPGGRGAGAGLAIGSPAIMSCGPIGLIPCHGGRDAYGGMERGASLDPGIGVRHAGRGGLSSGHRRIEMLQPRCTVSSQVCGSMHVSSGPSRS